MKKEDLVCEYCNMGIKETDYKCPHCGANCTDVIKRYQNKQQEKIDEENAQRRNLQNKSLKTVSRIGIIIFIISGLSIAAFILAFLFISHKASNVIDDSVEKTNSSDKFNLDIFEEEKQENVSVGYNEEAKTNKFNVILDSYEFYEYTSDIFPQQLNTKEGYQKIAFNFVITNNMQENLNINFDAKVSLTADDYSVEESDLEVSMHCKTTQGKDSYPKLAFSSVVAGDKIQGYVGYLVPKSAKVLKFRVGDYVTITMDNPAYEG